MAVVPMPGGGSVLATGADSVIRLWGDATKPAAATAAAPSRVGMSNGIMALQVKPPNETA